MKIIHLAKLISAEGKVSPLCAKRPRPINLRKETWTIVESSVTCHSCRQMITEKVRFNFRPDLT